MLFLNFSVFLNFVVKEPALDLNKSCLMAIFLHDSKWGSYEYGLFNMMSDFIIAQIEMLVLLESN